MHILRNENGNGSPNTLIASVIVGLSLLWAFVYFYQAAEGKLSYVKIKSQPIESFEDHISSAGTFYMGSGTVEGELKYYYTVKEDGGRKPESISGESAVLYDLNNGEKPHIDTYEGKYGKRDIGYFLGGFLRKDFQYKVYIPDGSIKEGYKVDLMNGESE